MEREFKDQVARNWQIISKEESWDSDKEEEEEIEEKEEREEEFGNEKELE